MAAADKVLVIIPAFNEEANIEKVVDELERDYPQFDYIVVNDGSTDRTARICRERGYHLLDLPVNLGLAGCFQAGMKYAYLGDYDCAVQFDGDGQHRPEYIEALRRKMEEGYDIVIGSRFVEGHKDASMRMIGSRILSAAIRLTTGVKVADPTSGMRMFNRDMIGELAWKLNFGPAEAGGPRRGGPGDHRAPPGRGELPEALRSRQLHAPHAFVHPAGAELPKTVSAARWKTRNRERRIPRCVRTGAGGYLR